MIIYILLIAFEQFFTPEEYFAGAKDQSYPTSFFSLTDLVSNLLNI
jgi:hypothetical protein